MSIDLTPAVPAVIPATEAKVYPLKWIRMLHLEGPPSGMRAYAELAPYRRLYADIPVMSDVATPVLDGEGQPVLDGEGQPVTQMVSTPTGEVINTLVGAELKPNEQDGDITVVEIPNILLAAQVDADGEAKVEAAIGAFLMSGGNLGALTMTCVTLMVKQIAIAQGKLTA